MQRKSLIASLGLGFALTLLCAPFLSAASEKTSKAIGISQVVEHPALDAVRMGLLTSLKEQGFEVGKNLTVDYENAQGNLVTATQIASKLLSAPLDTIVAISTPSAQTVLYAATRSNKKVPIVFAAVSDPVSAKLEPAESHYPITGVTDSPDLKALLEVMQHLLPNLKSVGLMFNPSESNSVSTITQFKALLKARGIIVREVTVTSTANVAQAMQSLIGKVDVLYFPQDNTVVSAINTVVSIATPSAAHPGIPLFCNDPLLVKQGVLAAVGYDYTEVGKEAGRVVAKLLKGETIKDIPIHNPPHTTTVINKPLAEKFGLSENLPLLTSDNPYLKMIP